jgi:N-acetylglucosamine-6-phosphate deacetylase
LVPDNAERIDCGNDFLAPGLIDLQIAGAGGFLFSEYPTAEALRAITDTIVRTGTTGFLIVLPTNTFEVYHEVIRIAGENPNPAFLGLHFEGPYINPVRSGAHFKECIKIPKLDEVKSLLGSADGIVKMLTIAPEICDEEIIRYLTDKGVVLAAGHSNATFKEAVLGFERGIRTTTHLFNAMSQVHHRDPGLPGAVSRARMHLRALLQMGYMSILIWYQLPKSC